MTDKTLSEFFHTMGDVAEGSISLEEICAELTRPETEKIKEIYNMCASFISNLKTNIKEATQEATKKNKEKTQDKMEWKINDNVVAYSMQPKEKLSFWARFKKNAGATLDNVASVMAGKKSLKDGVKTEISQAHNTLIEDYRSYRDMAGGVEGKIKGLNKTLQDLKKMKEGPENPYDKLDDNQFRVAMAQAYQNVVKMEHADNMPDFEKNKVMADIQPLLDSAKKRFPDAQSADKGDYFTNPKLQNTESQLFSYMKTDAAKTPDVDTRLKVARFESWRQGKDFEVPVGGGKGLSEMPFHNASNYGQRGDTRSYTAENFGSPLKAGQSVKSQAEMARLKAIVSDVKFR